MTATWPPCGGSEVDGGCGTEDGSPRHGDHGT